MALRVAAFAFIALLAALSVDLPTLAHAQLQPTADTLYLSASPQYPGPHQRINLSVQSSAFDLSTSDIVWRQDGATVASGRGVNAVDIETGALGQATTVSVSATSAGGATAATSATIIPAAVDILMSSDSYVPPFFRGRPLPSAGTDVILQAIPHLFDSQGAAVPDSSIDFTWQENGQAIPGASGTGRSSAIVPMQHLGGSDEFSVVARSVSGPAQGKGSISVPATAPVLDLYEDHPLYGIRYRNALGGSAAVPQSEMSFAAVPYYAQASSTNDSALQYAWQVNGTAIPANSAQPSELTINADKSSGQAFIQLSLTEPSNVFFDANGAWNVVFSAASASTSPFSAPSSQQL